MKRTILITLSLIFLGGCESFVSLEKLEAEAMLTGDWSAVGRRERIIERRKMRNFMQCPPGFVGYCEQIASREDCTCVDTDVIHSLLGY